MKLEIKPSLAFQLGMHGKPPCPSRCVPDRVTSCVCDWISLNTHCTSWLSCALSATVDGAATAARMTTRWPLDHAIRVFEPCKRCGGAPSSKTVEALFAHL